MTEMVTRLRELEYSAWPDWSEGEWTQFLNWIWHVISGDSAYSAAFTHKICVLARSLENRFLDRHAMGMTWMKVPWRFYSDEDLRINGSARNALP